MIADATCNPGCGPSAQTLPVIVHRRVRVIGHDRHLSAMKSRAMLAVSLGLILTLPSCMSADDPRRLPFLIDIRHERAGQFWALDIDGDSRDEVVGRMIAPRPIGEPGPASALLFVDDDGTTLDQTNYDGLVLRPRAADVTGDGVPEVLAPLQRHDSLFMSIASSRGRKIGSFLIMTGNPRLEPDGALPWDPQVMELWTADLDADGSPELVSSVSTAFARAPRGVMIHDLPSGQPLGTSLQGTGGPLARVLSDFDHDGVPELLVATMKTMHGARTPGFDDSHSYLLYYELFPGVELAWSRETRGVGYPRLSIADFDGDGDEEVLFAEIGEGSGFLELELLTPGSWTIERRRTINELFSTILLVDLDRDSRVEVVGMRMDGRVTVVNGSLEPVRSVNLPLHVTGWGEVLPDADGDGAEEIAYPLSNGFVLLSPDLRLKARYPTGMAVSVQNPGLGRPPYLLIHGENDTRFATLRPNPAYLIYRYGGYVALLVLATLTVLAMTRLRDWHDWHRLALVTGPHGGPPESSTLLVLNRRGHLLWHDPVFGRLKRRWLENDRSDLPEDQREFMRFVMDAIADFPVRERTRRVAVPAPGETGERSLIIVTPVLVGNSRDPHWIVRRGSRNTSSINIAWAWPMMAQRIAHSLKQPLTHMLLTVQRLQAEYRERAPGVAARLDPYADRIQNGIGQLRHHTSSFLKLVDLAEPDLQQTDVSEFVTAFVRRRAAQLPPDMRLQADVNPGIVAVVDAEQLYVALDNLVSNAVDAMVQGGAITVSIRSVHAVKVTEDDGHRDYVVIEVMDTGKGIPEEQRTRIFEPGFSNAQDGSGLGLAIVRKIVEDHDGQVSVDSDPGLGSVFTIHLPFDGPRKQQPSGRESSPSRGV